jgi:hypothetical protein
MNEDNWNDRELAALKRALKAQHGTHCSCTSCAKELRENLEADKKEESEP